MAAVGRVIVQGLRGRDLSEGLTATAADIDKGKTALVDGVVLVGTSTKVDTADATVTAADMLSGKIAYAKGVRIVGGLSIETYVAKAQGTYNGKMYSGGWQIDISAKKNKSSEVKAVVFFCSDTSNNGSFDIRGLSVDGIFAGGAYLSNMTYAINGNAVDVRVDFNGSKYVGSWELYAFYS